MHPEISPTKVFEVLLDALKDAYKELLDLGLKISGVVIVVLGWFAAQANPLAFLCSAPASAYLALFLVFAGFALVCFLFTVVYRRAQTAQKSLPRAATKRCCTPASKSPRTCSPAASLHKP